MFRSFLFIAFFFGSCSSTIATETQGIAVSIKPLHALVQGVMGDTGEADLLMKQNASPHGYSLRPSQLSFLQNARIVFYIDDAFEPFLRNALKNLPEPAEIVEMARQPGMKILPLRRNDDWDSHDHEEKGHVETKMHATSNHDHSHGGDDLHIWLDTNNARQMIMIIADKLGRIFPDNQIRYQENAQNMLLQIDQLDAEITGILEEVKDKPYIVLHDAFQYFEHQHGLNGVGSITIEPNQPPSITDIQAIRETLESKKVVCVFREPQFDDRLIETVIEGSNVQIGMLDPIGATLKQTPDFYSMLLRDLATEIAGCLNISQ
jgi:zinc transport system substrate-binding protein